MSLFRSERLSIALCSDTVALRVSAGRGNTVPEKSCIIAVGDTPGGTSWEGALKALGEGLDQVAPRLPTKVIVSSQFVRVSLLPWSPLATSESERMALALACLESRYGSMDGWDVRLDTGGFGAACVTCAMETAFLESIQHLLVSHRMACTKVVPYFVACWNRWKAEICGPEALFAVHEAGGLTLATIRDRHWHSLRALGSCADAETLMQTIAREGLLQGFPEPPPVWAHADLQPSSTDPHGGLSVRWLVLPPSQDDDVAHQPVWTMARLGALA